MIKPLRTVILLSLALSALTLKAATLELSPASRSSVALTIYNSDLALVNDAYDVDIPAGDSVLNFSAVSPLIDYSSAILHPIPRTLRVQDQFYRDVMTPQDLLLRSVGQTVSLASTDPDSGQIRYERARVLAVSGGLVLEINGRYETELAGRWLVYDSLPEGVLQPTLSIGIHSEIDTQNRLVLSYLTGGFSWRADYIVRLNNARDTLQLRTMATLQNDSDIDFKAAQIELVAGSVNRARSPVPLPRGALATMAAESDQVVSPMALADLHLYSLPGRVDLDSNSARQVRLFEARDVPVERFYRLRGQPGLYYAPDVSEQTLKIDSYIQFYNESGLVKGSDTLGVPMPAGVVRTYVQSETEFDRLQFIGEDSISHTPKHAKVRLKMGQAFDLSARRKQLAFKHLPVAQPHRHHNEATMETEISNAGDEAVSVQVEETFSGEWFLVDGPVPDERDARSARWNVSVPAHGQAVLTLVVRSKR